MIKGILLVMSLLLLVGCEQKPELTAYPDVEERNFPASFDSYIDTEDYVEECFEYKNVSKYELIEPNNCERHCGDYKSCIKYMELIFVDGNVPLIGPTCYTSFFGFDTNYCFYVCGEVPPIEPYIRYWNETVCIKSHLVRVIPDE